MNQKNMATTIKSTGFTIIEVLVVTVLIGILAGLTAFAFGNWQQTVAKRQVQSDLEMAAAAMQNAQNFGNAYPVTFPNTVNPSPAVILEMTAAPSGTYCINGYSTKISTVRLSVSSTDPTIVRNSTCSDPSNGSVLWSKSTAAPKGMNVAPPLSTWTLAGGATYNTSTGELTLGAGGTATSPNIRVNGATGINVNGQFYATVQSSQASLQPYGGWHTGSSYFTSDGTTLTNNTIGYTGNGCAMRVTLGSWNASNNGDCNYPLGNSIEYTSIKFYGSSSGYASPDLKVKNITAILY